VIQSEGVVFDLFPEDDGQEDEVNMWYRQPIETSTPIACV
jgi:hypothetical protein